MNQSELTMSTPSGSESNAPEAVAPTDIGARLLCNGSSKKGESVWAFSIAMPGNRCPFASTVCSRWCYADVGRFPLNHALYQRNYEATKRPDFPDRLRDEVVTLAWRYAGARISICAHEKGEFHSIDYVRAWGKVTRAARAYPNVAFFFYTRSWRNPRFRTELDAIADDCPNLRVNLSLDRELIDRHGLPKRVGDGLLAYLAESDQDAPPPGVDIVFRNLRLLDREPMERLGGSLVCPNESSLYVAKRGGQPVIKGGKALPIRCQECRCCIDRDLVEWDRIKARYAATPGARGEDVATAA